MVGAITVDVIDIFAIRTIENNKESATRID